MECWKFESGAQEKIGLRNRDLDRGAWPATVRRVSDSDTTDPHSIAEAQRSTGSLLVCSGLRSCLTTELNLSFRISDSELFPLTRKTYKFKDTLN